jgi:hypothetical protein
VHWVAAESHIRTRDDFPGREREKVRVSRPGADENDLAGPLSHRSGAQTERISLGVLPEEMASAPYLIISQETGFRITVLSGRLS